MYTCPNVLFAHLLHDARTGPIPFTLGSLYLAQSGTKHTPMNTQVGSKWWVPRRRQVLFWGSLRSSGRNFLPTGEPSTGANRYLNSGLWLATWIRTMPLSSHSPTPDQIQNSLWLLLVFVLLFRPTLLNKVNCRTGLRLSQLKKNYQEIIYSTVEKTFKSAQNENSSGSHSVQHHPVFFCLHFLHFAL